MWQLCVGETLAVSLHVRLLCVWETPCGLPADSGEIVMN